MKAVILAGGLGTRISEETTIRPKPMIEIGGRPVLWHIMKMYSVHGIREFVICLGYKGYMIKEYFINYFRHGADLTVDTANGDIQYHQNVSEPWKVTLVETGENSMTGGRLGRVRAYLEGEENFCFTYGDGVSDVDITASIAFHKQHGARATMTAVVPPGRFGAVKLAGDVIERFEEKPPGDQGLINGGFFVLQHDCLDLIKGDDTIWEGAPLETLAATGQLRAFRHTGFWQPMDTLRDKNHLESLWKSGAAPWKKWKDAP
ncbi:glucose-1-phosphate cytidylyltransferase [Pleomorphomonas sp. JP5]|uniref:glucose-1-phosphate cytidylyltransferase n=1 Tax=Pleomorphomonas sp. JP5 TaxID=2942998 RepID=UPI0020435207|nr:glucose-1-phosphate cytidylyltransferase [Pleomorphomonas sp. JP5]MCM5557652.1 glucose-1-phosphate cytidylyltransferase [Pleomorphomonas sp. JP5]